MSKNLDLDDVAAGNPLARKELDQLRADAKRMDWLGEPSNGIGNVQLPTACVERNLHSLRAAIDAAMTLDKDKEHNA